VGGGIGAAAGAGSQYGLDLAKRVDSGDARKSLIAELGSGAGGFLADTLEAQRDLLPNAGIPLPSSDGDFTAITRSLDVMRRWQAMIDESRRTGAPLPASPFAAPLTFMDVAPVRTLPQMPKLTLPTMALMAPPITSLDQLTAAIVKADPIGEFNQKLAQAIATYEKVNPTYNNPGAITEHGALAKYPDFTTGWQKLLGLIDVYEKRGVTLEEFFARYAPKDDHKTPLLRGNDPEAYAAFVAGKLGIDVYTPLNQIIQQLQQQNAAAPPMPTPAPIGPPTSSLRPPWMAPPASDNAQRGLIMPVSYPVNNAPLSQEWAPMAAELNRPFAPMPNTVSNSRTVTYGAIHVTIEGSQGLDADQVARKVMEQLREKEAFDAQLEISQLTAAYG
jgi:hypothetical protein